MMSRLVKQWLLLTTVTAIVIVVFAPTPNAASNTNTNPNEGWVIPRIQTVEQAQQIVAGLQKSNLWGTAADKLAEDDSAASQWRLAGITGGAQSRTVIVQFGDDRVLALKSGDKFPDGTVITGIRENGVCVSLSGQKRFLPLSGQTIPIVW
jgi:hypothetical protein